VSFGQQKVGKDKDTRARQTRDRLRESELYCRSPSERALNIRIGYLKSREREEGIERVRERKDLKESSQSTRVDRVVTSHS